MIHKNGEGYLDPTASRAIWEADKPPEDLSRAIRLMKFAADCLGYEVINRIRLRDKKTGQEYQ